MRRLALWSSPAHEGFMSSPALGQPPRCREGAGGAVLSFQEQQFGRHMASLGPETLKAPPKKQALPAKAPVAEESDSEESSSDEEPAPAKKIPPTITKNVLVTAKAKASAPATKKAADSSDDSSESESDDEDEGIKAKVGPGDKLLAPTKNGAIVTPEAQEPSEKSSESDSEESDSDDEELCDFGIAKWTSSSSTHIWVAKRRMFMLLALCFSSSFQGGMDAHVVNFFKDMLWETLDQEWMECLSQESPENLLGIPSGLIQDVRCHLRASSTNTMHDRHLPCQGT